MYKMYLPIGDFSGDHHCKCRNFLVEANKPVSDVRLINHNIETVTGIDLTSFCDDYEDNGIPEEVAEKLKDFNWPYIWKCYQDSDGYHLETFPESSDWLMAHLWMFLLRKTDPTLEIDFCSEDFPLFWSAVKTNMAILATLLATPYSSEVAGMTRGRYKKRGYHQTGYKQDGKTLSENLCPDCLSFGCDPFSMSLEFRYKVSERRRKGLCPCCGKPEQFCSCKSSEKLEPGSSAIRTHNNKKLRQAMDKINLKDAAYRQWDKDKDKLILCLGEKVYSDCLNSLSHLLVPIYPWPSICAALDGKGFNLYKFKAGWEN